MNRAIFRAIFLTAAIVSMPLVSNSALAGGCFGTSCLGKDPVRMSCGSTITKHEISDGGFRIQLRYSGECNAMWARVIAPNYNVNRNYTIAQVYGCRSYVPARDFKTNVSNGRSPRHSYLYPAQVQHSSGNYWTTMIPNRYWARACINYEGNYTLPSRPFSQCTRRG